MSLRINPLNVNALIMQIKKIQGVGGKKTIDGFNELDLSGT